MGNNLSMTRNINFEDMQFAINEHKGSEYMHSRKTLIINTLEAHQQSCLISGTLNIESEVEVLNAELKKNKDIQIIIYGMNSSDPSCAKKYEQLIKLGFYNTYIYSGGICSLTYQVAANSSFLASDLYTQSFEILKDGKSVVVPTPTPTPTPVATPTPTAKPVVKKTITCVKGKKTIKKTAVSPKCPAGYKLKK